MVRSAGRAGANEGLSSDVMMTTMSRDQKSPYTRFRGHALSLNDLLAIDRTVLANERTILAYARTSLAMVIVGGSCIKFFNAVWIQAIGVAFILGAGAILMLGWRRFRRLRRDLAAAAIDESTAG